MPFFFDSLCSEDKQKLVRSVSILKTAYLSTPKPTAYQELLKFEGIDIAQQSKINYQNLIIQLDDISWLPLDEQQLYLDENGKKLRFSKDEFLLMSIWRTQLAPLFTLKHATDYVEDLDTLKSLGEREKSGNPILNAHTPRHAIRHNTFAVLGLEENHDTPDFLGKEADEIIIHLNKMEENIIFLRGLWISTHLSDFYLSRSYNPLEFAGTKRQQYHEKEGLKKIINYTRQDGTQFSRRCNYKDEIFAANPSIEIIFDALLFQFILELRYLGKGFREYVTNNLDNNKILIYIFHTIFPSLIYPEAKIPRLLPIKDMPYVTIRPKTSEEINKQLLVLFEAIKKDNYQVIEELMDNRSLINKKILKALHS